MILTHVRNSGENGCPTVADGWIKYAQLAGETAWAQGRVLADKGVEDCVVSSGLDLVWCISPMNH